MVNNLRNARPVTGKYIVPRYDAISYDALTHGANSGCGGYFNVMQAYGDNAGNCNQRYLSKLCGSCNR